MSGGQFVPGQGSGCDTWLTFENGSQGGILPLASRRVKKITEMPLAGGTADGSFFVRTFARPQKPLEMGTSGANRRNRRVGQHGNEENPKPCPRVGFRLARMLLPDANAMIADFFSTTTHGRYTKAAAPRPADTPRGLYEVPSFFSHCLLRESFHKSVGTQSRPLRGGKEGSVCRVM